MLHISQPCVAWIVHLSWLYDFSSQKQLVLSCNDWILKGESGTRDVDLGKLGDLWCMSCIKNRLGSNSSSQNRHSACIWLQDTMWWSTDTLRCNIVSVTNPWADNYVRGTKLKYSSIFQGIGRDFIHANKAAQYITNTLWILVILHWEIVCGWRTTTSVLNFTRIEEFKDLGQF